MSRLLVIPVFLLAFAIPVLAASEPVELQKLRASYSGDDAREASRSQFILSLAKLREIYLKQHRNDDAFAVDAEVQKHPLPVTADAKLLSHLIVGQWRSPREDYLYRVDGTWTMLPAEGDIPHGHWHIKGNQFSYADADEKKPSDYTLLLLNADYFIYSDGDYVYYDTRVK